MTAQQIVVQDLLARREQCSGRAKADLTLALKAMGWTDKAPVKVSKVKAQKAVVKVETDNSDAWRSYKPSKSQIARIHLAERTLGYKLTPRNVVATKGEASDLYQSLRSECVAKGLWSVQS